MEARFEEGRGQDPKPVGNGWISMGRSRLCFVCLVLVQNWVLSGVATARGLRCAPVATAAGRRRRRRRWTLTAEPLIADRARSVSRRASSERCRSASPGAAPTPTPRRSSISSSSSSSSSSCGDGWSSSTRPCCTCANGPTCPVSRSSSAGAMATCPTPSSISPTRLEKYRSTVPAQDDSLIFTEDFHSRFILHINIIYYSQLFHNYLCSGIT